MRRLARLYLACALDRLADELADRSTPRLSRALTSWRLERGLLTAEEERGLRRSWEGVERACAELAREGVHLTAAPGAEA